MLMPSPEEGPSTQTATLIFPSTSKSTAIHAIPEIVAPTLAITRVNLEMRRAMSVPPYGPGPTQMYALPTLRTTSPPVQRQPSRSIATAPALHRSGAVHRKRQVGSKRLKTQFNTPRNAQPRIATPPNRPPPAPLRAQTRKFSFVEWLDQHFEFAPRPLPSRSRTLPATPTRKMSQRPRRGNISISKSVGTAWGQVSRLSSSFGNIVVTKIRGQRTGARNLQIQPNPRLTTVLSATVSENPPQNQVTEPGFLQL